ncbi:DUF1365 domain-containing protein [Thioalkalivibrio sp. HK1]|uniref:DUF1365 domain-containing protein n=1 Tax=Thioalkalivibrio sp. HK1 TaxID=1469245 RepID=UPI00046EA363|nr:DUF1365 domain-containing protein [Thioalkalivibrio sp. HK1]
MNSRLYIGTVHHRRITTPAHAFRYRLFMPYLDLDELPDLLDPLWFCSARKTAPIRFRREDYLGSHPASASRPLARAVRDLVEERLSDRPRGSIRLLAHLRYFGLCFNPVVFYYCFERAEPAEPKIADPAERLHSIVAEITNTPWLERHSHVLDCRGSTGDLHRFSFDKAFHVSPFMPMDHRYHWRINTPKERLRVSMRSERKGRSVFCATLDLKARPFEGRVLARTVARHPWMSASVIKGIYWQALGLAIKRARFHAHPKHLRVSASPRSPAIESASDRRPDPSGKKGS